MGEITIGAGVDFLVLERLHEALGHGVIVGTAGPAHAGLDPGGLETGDVVAAGVLPGFNWSPQRLVKRLSGRLLAERLARPGVEGHGHRGEVVRAVQAQVGALREILAQQPVGVLVRAACHGPWGSQK